MATYVCETTFGSFEFEADFAQAADNIVLIHDDGEPETTHWQVADARHYPEEAAVLLLGDFGREYWLSPDAVETENKDGETLYDGMTEDEYIRDLIVSVE